MMEIRSWKRTLPAIALALILAVYLLAGLRIALALPLGHGPDEVQHLQFVRFVAESGQLPTMALPPEDNVASQESAQPPLYYFLVAGLTFWSTCNPALQVEIPLLSRLFGLTPTRGGLPALYASPTAWWPAATVASGYAARGISLLAGFLALLCLYGFLRQLTHSLWLAIAGLGWLAWNFNYPYVHAFVTNDALLTLLVAGSLWLLARGLAGAPTGRMAIGLGLLLGGLALTKLNGLPVVVVSTLGLALVRSEERANDRPGVPLWLSGLTASLSPLGQGLARPGRGTGSRQGLRALVLVAGGAFVVAGWWYGRNLLLYREPTGLSWMAAIEQAKGGLYDQPLGWAELWPITQGVVSALLYDYRPWPLLVGLNLLGWLGALVALGRPAQRRWVMILAGIILLVGVGYLGWAARFVYGRSPRLLLPAGVALAGLWALGFATWLPRRWHLLVPLLLLPALALHLRAGLDARWSPDASPTSYTFLPVSSQHDAPAVDQARDVTFGSHLRLKGYAARRDEHQVLLATHWELLEGIRDPSTSFYVHLVDAQGRRVAQVDTYPEIDALPLVAWRRGQTMVCLYRLSVPADTGALQVRTGVYSRQTKRALPAAEGGQDVPGGDLLLTTLP